MALTCEVPVEAEMFTTVFDRTGKVRTAKPAVVLPAGTTIHDGGCAAPGTLLAMPTPSPPSGAGALSVRVAAESWPPFTVEGFKTSDVRLTAELVKLAVIFRALLTVTMQ